MEHSQGVAIVYLYTISVSDSTNLQRKLITPFFSKESQLSLSHWALRVRTQCYEVTSIDSQPWLGNDKVHKMKKSSASDWEALRDSLGIQHERFKIGLTTWEDEEIGRYASRIWNTHLHVDYNLNERNCQVFAEILFRKILVPKTHPDNNWLERRSWHYLPDKFHAVKVAGRYASYAIAAGAELVENPVIALPLALAAPVVRFAPKAVMKGRQYYVKKKIKDCDEYEDAIEALAR